MFKRSFTPIIQEFPADGRIWRVDFLGGLELNPAIHDEPTVQVIISPLRDATVRNPKELSSVKAVIDEERMVIRIGVGQLPYLKIGSLWKNSCCLQYSAGEKRTFHLTINKAQGLFKANRVVDGAELIQPLYHRIGPGADSFCVTLAHEGDPPGLIIPAIELLRFYYATSTTLARTIFIGDFFQNLNGVIDPHHSAHNAAESIMLLKLRGAIYDIEGWIIGRILTAPEAKQCLKGLRASIVSQSSSGKKVVYTTAKFPFSGKTNLTVRGKRIKTGNGQWRFLVSSLEHCTAPFPFENLIVDREFSNPSFNGLSSTDPQLDWLPAHIRKKSVTPVNRPTIQSKREAAKDHAPTVFPLIADAFAFLRDKKIKKLSREQLVELCKSSGAEGQSVFADVFSTGAGSYASGNTVAPAEIVLRQRSQGLAPEPEVFTALLKELNVFGAEAYLRAPSNETLYIPMHGPGLWRYLDPDLKTPRGVVIGDVLWRNRWWCLVEFRQREKDSCNMGILTYKDTPGMLSNAVLNKILYGLGNVRGIWKNIEPAYRGSVFVKYIKHSSTTPKMFAEAVITWGSRDLI